MARALAVRPAVEPIEMYLFSDQRGFRRFVARYFPQAPERRALYIKGNGPGIVLAYYSNQFDVDLRHECTHALIHASLPMMPLWLDEGLAMFAEGALLMGKTNMQELSRGWTSNNGAFGAVRNPRDPARIPGGSSGGSAAAVASGIAPLAVAEDTWGSIRVPAAMCGTAGLRPTVGRYPNDGIMPLTRGLFDQVGPVARTVEDLILFDAAAAGDDRPIEAADLRGVRLGVPEAYLADLDAEVAHVVEQAFGKLREAGAELLRTPLPAEAEGCADIAGTIIASENEEAITAFLREHGAGVTFDDVIAAASPNIRARYESLPPTPAEYEAAMAKRERLRVALPAHFTAQGIEALAFPPLLTTAPPLGDNPEVRIHGVGVPLRTVVGRNTALGNCASLASLVLVAGYTPQGMPVALEFDALPEKDRRLLALGLSLEAALAR